MQNAWSPTQFEHGVGRMLTCHDFRTGRVRCPDKRPAHIQEIRSREEHLNRASANPVRSSSSRWAFLQTSTDVMSQLTIDLPTHVTADEARLLLSIKLYEDKRISLGKAAELAGYSKRAFMDLLAQKGIEVINISPEELDRELDD